jgi:hypothetical protein
LAHGGPEPGPHRFLGDSLFRSRDGSGCQGEFSSLSAALIALAQMRDIAGPGRCRQSAFGKGTQLVCIEVFDAIARPGRPACEPP